MKTKNFFVVAFICLATVANAKTIYVAADGSNAKDGTTWANAVADVQYAFQIASSGDEIWMAGGTYDLSTLTALESPKCLVEMKDGVNLYGGFAKGDTDKNARALANADEPWNFTNATIFTSATQLTVRPFDRSDKNVASTWQSVVNGIKLYNINTTNNRIMYLNTGTTFENCWVDGCVSDATNATFIYMERGGYINNCMFENCKLGAKPTAGIVQLRGSLPTTANNFEEKGCTLENCIFQNNACTSLSVYVTGGTLLDDRSNDMHVRNCTFTGNTAYVLNLSDAGTGRITLADNCVFENNTGESTATTNYAASLLNVTGSGAYLNRAIIRNNKNTVDASGDYKNSLIFVNTGNITNSLIVNNESQHLNLAIKGNLVNTTVANNTGSIIMDGTGALLNTICTGNVPDTIKLISETTYQMYSAFTANKYIVGTSGGSEENIELSTSPFVLATTFTGCPTTTAQKAELAAADFSLATGSACINAGTTKEGYLYGTGGLVENIKDTFAYDLAGNARITDDNKISMGCYQGALASGIEDVTVENQIRMYTVADGLVVNSAVNGQLTVYTVNGQQLYAGSITAGVLHISLKTKGMYVVTLRHANGTETHKVVL